MTQNDKIIGRKDEIKLLSSCYESGKAEMVILYGRRRVGKTFLIKKMFGDRFAFYMTGLYRATKKRQLSNFAYSLSEYTGNDEPVPESWMDAFHRLKEYLKTLDSTQRKVVFIDELPWLDTKKSDLLAALELFWNGWGNNRDDLMLILCGSATSWITDRLLGDQGGLFNRDTLRIYLSPFTLLETEQFLASKSITPSRYEIAEYYMAMGGIPYYLDKIQRGKSVSQNIDLLFFKRRGLLWDEFKHLYQTLFKGNETYVRIVRLLNTRREGFTRDEIISKLGLPNNGETSKYIANLCDCDLIGSYKQFDKASNNTVYKLIDLYTLFYFRFLEHQEQEGFWSANIDNPSRRAWSGYAFESLALWHIPQIKKALGISGVSSSTSTYRRNIGDKVQIDLIIDRRDDVVNMCEIKFCIAPYAITSSYANDLERKKEILQTMVPQSKSIQTTMVTTFGLENGAHNTGIDAVVTLDDLFE